MHSIIILRYCIDILVIKQDLANVLQVVALLCFEIQSLPI